MNTQHIRMKYFILGFLLALCLTFVVGWNASNSSRSGSDYGYGYAAASICCSDDGQIVFASDLDGVYVSKDSGRTWDFVSPKK